MMKKIALLASISAAFVAAGATVYEVNVPTGNVQTNFTAAQKTAIAALGADDEVQKTGGGTLHISTKADISSFDGTIRISDGVYQIPGSTGYLGTTNGPTIVESGATLRVAGYTRADYYADEDIRIAGTGYGDMGGALVGGLNDNVNLGRLTLTADATTYIPDTTSHSMSFTARPVDLGNHTLTMKGISTFQPSEMVNPGHLVFDCLGTTHSVEIPQNCDFPGGPENTITFRNGAYAYAYSYHHTNMVPWTLRIQSGSYGLSAKGYEGRGDFFWYGPVELPDSGSITINSNGRDVHLLCPISGGAGIKIASSNGGHVYFHATNTYTGALDVSGGRLVPMTEESLPGWDGDDWRVTVVCSATSYAIYPAGTNAVNPYGWKPERIGQLFSKMRAKGPWNVGLYADEGMETVCELPPFEPNVTNYFDQYIYTVGKGRKVVKGDYPDGFRIYKIYGSASNLVFSAKDPATSSFRLGQFNIYQSSHVRFENLGYAQITSYPYVGCNADQYSTCVVGTNTVFGILPGKGKGLYVSNGRHCHAAAWILPGAIVSNGVWVGTANVYTNSCGMLVQKGGLVHSDHNTCSFGEARWGMGYLELAGGRFASTQKVHFGVYEAGAGHMFQTGGEFEMLPLSTFQIGGMGTGLVHVAGGTFKSAVPAYAPMCNGKTIEDRTNGCGRVSVAAGARPVFEAGVRLADRINSVGMVELSRGGVMETQEIVKRAKTSNGSMSTLDAKAYVNFNGGGVCAISNNVELLGTGNSAVDRATVYAAGAILEAAEGVSANVSVPLQAATGGGIASLALPAEPFDAYHCAPVVTIYGDGQGAAAVAEYDSDNDVITNIVVTSPGWGYTAANTTAVLHWCGNVNRPDVPLTVTVAANAATGGLTKRGPGRIALTAANTYGGATVVEGGTLAATVADAIPSGSPVTVKAGGVLELGAGVGYPADITADVDCEDRTRRYALISCPDGSPAGAPAVKGLGPGWVVKRRGTLWTASYQRGAVFSLR